jgi:hypothetical protein
MVTILRSGSELTIEVTDYKSRSVAKKTFNLNERRGERVRVHINTNGEYSIETKPRQNLLVCELDIPARKYVYTEKIVDGETVVESSENELKLEEITMIKHLKEVIKK